MNDRVQLLDYGRFVAALAVLCFHYFFNGINGGKITSLEPIADLPGLVRYGYLGVEFFFLISGYVIFFSAYGKTARRFIVSRGVRLYPAFAAAVIFTTLLAQMWGGPLMSVTPQQAVANLTFIPNAFGYSYVDGVYWTLLYEIKFYLVVFLILLTGLGRWLKGAFIAWPFAILAAQTFGISGVEYLGSYYVYFATGAMFAIVSSGSRSTLSLLSLGLAIALCFQHAVGGAEEMSQAKGVEYSGAVIAIIVAAMMAFFAALVVPAVRKIELPASQLASDLTYPLYLIHAHAGYMVISTFANEQNKWLVYTITIALALTSALAIHTLVERAPKAFWYRAADSTVGAAVGFIENSWRRVRRWMTLRSS